MSNDSLLNSLGGLKSLNRSRDGYSEGEKNVAWGSEEVSNHAQYQTSSLIEWPNRQRQHVRTSPRLELRTCAAVRVCGTLDAQTLELRAFSEKLDEVLLDIVVLVYLDLFQPTDVKSVLQCLNRRPKSVTPLAPIRWRHSCGANEFQNADRNWGEPSKSGLD